MEQKKHTRLFIASSDLFSNFQTRISLFNVSTIDDIITFFKNELNLVLKENNLSNLQNELAKKNFHIHSQTIEDILTSNEEDIFYICDHCNIIDVKNQ